MFVRAAAVIVLAALAVPQTMLAQDGVPPAPHDLWQAWYLQPTILVGMLAAARIYARGTSRLWAQAGRRHGIAIGRAAAWAVGLLALFVALISPLHALGEALFSAHMAQHLLLVAVAAPLLVLGAPVLPLLWALPLRYRRRLHTRRWLRLVRIVHLLRRRMLLLWFLHVGTLWAWHAPALYELALRSEPVHAAEHTTLLGTAILFWWAAIPSNLSSRLRGGAGLPALFALALQGGVLGGLLLAARTPWYPAHTPWVAAWGLTPLADQQLAGLLMMLPGDAIYLGVALALAALWLRPTAASTRSAGVRPRTAAEKPVPLTRAGPASKGVEP